MTVRQLQGCGVRLVVQGVHVAAGTDLTPEVRCRAVRLALGDEVVFSHVTAAHLYRLPLPRRLAVDQRVHVVILGVTGAGARSGIMPHLGRLMSCDVLRLGGHRVTAPGRSWLDLAVELDLAELVTVGDAILREWARLPGLEDVVARSGRRRGVRRARAALSLLAPGVDSPMESRGRMILIRGGLPTPEVNAHVHDELGGWLARVDLLYRDERIVIEFDGEHHRGRDTFRSDRRRDNRLTLAGYTVLRFTAVDVIDHPWRVLNVVQEALERCAARRSWA